MKAKKLVIAIAIFGGVLFMAQAVNAYNVNGIENSYVKKSKIKR